VGDIYCLCDNQSKRFNYILARKDKKLSKYSKIELKVFVNCNLTVA
jgi:hypothetical protein